MPRSQTVATRSEAVDWPLPQQILLAVDSSDHSNRATSEATELAAAWGAQLTGCHVFAAALHDDRFRQMEGGLPEQFREEEELERQRDVHDTLITRGLRIITDSYLDQAARLCEARQVAFSRRALEGKNYRELASEANSGSYDLLVLGSLGLGAIAGSRVGTVCRRVARRSQLDTLVVKDPERDLREGPIVVAVDGSARAYGGLLTALELGRRWGVVVHVISAFDPYYHYVAFERIAGVLSEEAGKVFRFQEQEKLHEDIIDSGLAKIYEGHLVVARSIAESAGVAVETALLDGKAHDAVERYVAEHRPSLLVIGRTGIHADEGLDIGGNAEHMLEEVGCAVLLSHRGYTPRVEVVAEATTSWTHQAEERMKRVPSFVRSMARLAVLRYAADRGHTVVTERIVEEATESLCPGHARRAIEEIVEWSDEAEALLASSTDEATRADVRKRAEKKARRDGHGSVGAGHVEAFVEASVEVPAAGRCPFGHDGKQQAPAESGVHWTEAAEQRLLRVPDGFMRKLTRQRLESFAERKQVPEITPELMDEKYAEWFEGSDQRSMTMTWAPEALARIERVPDFVRGMVIQEVERCARKKGMEIVTPDAVTAASGDWARKGAFHSNHDPELYGGD